MKIRITATLEMEIGDEESWGDFSKYIKESPADVLEWLISDDTKLSVKNIETEEKVDL